MRVDEACSSTVWLGMKTVAGRGSKDKEGLLDVDERRRDF